MHEYRILQKLFGPIISETISRSPITGVNQLNYILDSALEFANEYRNKATGVDHPAEFLKKCHWSLKTAAEAVLFQMCRDGRAGLRISSDRDEQERLLMCQKALEQLMFETFMLDPQLDPDEGLTLSRPRR